MNTLLQLSFPLRSDLMTTVRLAAGGVCALKDIDFDTAEDCKVCITECLLMLKHRGYAFANVLFSDGDTLSVRVEGEGVGEETEAPEDELSLALLGALLGDVETFERNGKLFAISFQVTHEGSES